jgi:ABC-2 type transport system permease protein
MNGMMLVARREYRQHLRTRGFWIGLLLVPLVIIASTIVPSLLSQADQPNDALLIHDPSGRFQAAIERNLEREYQRAQLRRISIYAEQYNVHPPDAPIDWARHSLSYNNAETDAFVAAGGVDAALALLQPWLPAYAAPFEKVRRPLLLVPFPPSIVASQSEAALDGVLPTYIKGEPMIDAADGKRRVIGAFVLPVGEESGQTWPIWTNGAVGGTIQVIADAVNTVLHEDAMATARLDEAMQAALRAAITVPVIHSPPRGTTAWTDTARQLIPVGSAWLLWMTIIMVSNVLLSGLIEERSNKLIESLLAIVTPGQLMTGKLLGVAAIGFTIATTWTIFAVAAVELAPPSATLVLRPAMEPYMSAAAIASLSFYFVTGYLAVATLFLVIGSMCDSMHDAQAYMMPLILLLLAPLLLLRPALLNPHGLLPVTMSWVPIYTPFVMLSRLGTGVSLTELAANSVFLLAFVIAEVAIAARLFRATLLHAGQPPRWAALFRLAFARQ